MSSDELAKLGSAYALEGTEQVRALYRDWAASYDSDFIGRMAYVLPKIVAEVFQRHGGAGPILDVGCGSGAVGMELAGRRIDGLDLSPEMLAVAVEKGVYTRLIEGDLLGRLPLEEGAYRGVVSAGTFTHGHVGPEALDALIRVSAPEALFCLSVNAEHFAAQGFEAKLSDLHERGEITAPLLEDHPIYEGDHERGGDRSTVVVFRRR
jgi:predicted TPR repeat methyltransferase